MQTRLTDITAKASGAMIVAGALWFAINSSQRAGAGGVFHWPSLVLVMLLLLGVTLLSFEIPSLSALLRNLFQSPAVLQKKLGALERELRSMSDTYYQNGPEGLSHLQEDRSYPKVWSVMLSQLEARIAIDDIRALLKKEASAYEARMDARLGMIGSLASLAPSIGVLGTVLGLVRLLAHLEDVQSLGPNMSLALMTTLYGLFFSVLIFSPMEARLSALKDLNLKAYQVTLFWMHLIDNAKPSFYCDSEYANRS